MLYGNRMSLADLWNKEIIIVGKQWYPLHQSPRPGQFLLPAAALSLFSTMEDNDNRGLLFISAALSMYHYALT